MATEELITPENDTRNFVGYDLMGFPFNKKYPPNKNKYGEDWGSTKLPWINHRHE